jgi:hypothetical protein
MARLNHENLVTIFDVAEDHGDHYRRATHRVAPTKSCRRLAGVAPRVYLLWW